MTFQFIFCQFANFFADFQFGELRMSKSIFFLIFGNQHRIFECLKRFGEMAAIFFSMHRNSLIWNVPLFSCRWVYSVLQTHRMISHFLRVWRSNFMVIIVVVNFLFLFIVFAFSLRSGLKQSTTVCKCCEKKRFSSLSQMLCVPVALMQMKWKMNPVRLHQTSKLQKQHEVHGEYYTHAHIHFISRIRIW